MLRVTAVGSEEAALKSVDDAVVTRPDLALVRPPDEAERSAPATQAQRRGIGAWTWVFGVAIDAAVIAGVPVVWVQHGDDELKHGSAGWQWVPELVPLEREPLLHKAFNSAFEQTELETLLAGLGATHIVLAGATSNWCIRATAYAALERGYDLTLVGDAHTTETMVLDDGQREQPVQCDGQAGVTIGGCRAHADRQVQEMERRLVAVEAGVGLDGEDQVVADRDAEARRDANADTSRLGLVDDVFNGHFARPGTRRNLDNRKMRSVFARRQFGRRRGGRRGRLLATGSG